MPVTSPLRIRGSPVADVSRLTARLHAAVATVDCSARMSAPYRGGLHLALLGGVSQLVLGAGQFFLAAFLATRSARHAATLAGRALAPRSRRPVT